MRRRRESRREQRLRMARQLIGADRVRAYARDLYPGHPRPVTKIDGAQAKKLLAAAVFERTGERIA